MAARQHPARMASDLVALYQSELCNLKTAEKTSINFLSMLAQDNVQEAIGITDAIELHLAQVRGLSAVPCCSFPIIKR